MPLDDNLRLQILSINCPTQRLRRELEIVRKVSEGYNWFAHWKFSGSSQSYRFLGGGRGAGKKTRRPGWLGRSELSMRLRHARTWWTHVPITFPRTLILPPPFLSNSGHTGWFYLDDCDRPKPAFRLDDRDDYMKTGVNKHSCENAFFFAHREHLFLFRRVNARYRT